MYKLRLILLHTLHKLLSVFPRSNKTWAFIGWNRTPDGEIFTDNTKYLYLYVLEHQLEIKPVWLAKSRDDAKKMRSMGMKSYYQFSLTGIFYALHAGVTIIDANLHDWNFVYVGRSKLVQLLHGKGMKAQGYSKPGLRDHDLICYPSAGVQSMISGAFAQNAIKKITGYPRSDIVMGEEYQYSSFGVDDKTKDLISELKRKETKIIWYAPTFRRGQQFFDVDKILNLSKLTPQLKQKNYHLLISLHPKYSSQNSTISNSNVSFLPAQDFFPLYQYIDLLITDYSSSFTDFLLLDRPIIFYPYDLDEYCKNEGILIDYNSETPGPKAYTPEELHTTISNQLTDDTHKEERLLAKNKYHDFTDTDNAERVFNSITKELL